MPESSLTPDAAHPATPPRHLRAFLVILGLAILHAWGVWGYTGIFWGEHGRWLHAVARFAAGEVPYRDFAYSNPPLALWLIGGLARLTGATYAGISAITTAFYLLTFVVYVLCIRRLIPDLVLPVTLPALLFSVSYSFRHGVSLPAGTDSPAAPIGIICLLLGYPYTLNLGVINFGRVDLVHVGRVLIYCSLFFSIWSAAKYMGLFVDAIDAKNKALEGG